MAPHRDISPDDCRQCVRVFEVLREHHLSGDETWLTTEAIANRVELKKRATQDHLGHLLACSRIDVDRRTPLGVEVGRAPQTEAQKWAASVLTPDPACARCLLAIARYGWAGAVSMAEIAEEGEIALRTLERHRPHLRQAKLLEVIPRSVPVGYVGQRLRLPDRFTLLSGLSAPRLEGREREDAPRRANVVLNSIRWFHAKTEDERAIALQAVTWVLRLGWPEEALLAALDYRAARQVRHSGGYLHKLLMQVPREYIVPAQLVWTGEASPRVTECAECGEAVRTTRPGRVLCGGEDCLDSLPGTEHYASVAKIA